MRMMTGCEDCAWLDELDAVDEYEFDRTCQSCGGRLLNMQESFDRILHLKRTLEDAGVEYEYEEA